MSGAHDFSQYITIGIGGILTAGLSVAHTKYVLKEPFQVKSTFRDFFIGIILVTLLYQLVPDTVTNIGSFFTELKLPESMRGGGVDYNMKTGVPPF